LHALSPRVPCGVPHGRPHTSAASGAGRELSSSCSSCSVARCPPVSTCARYTDGRQTAGQSARRALAPRPRALQRSLGAAPHGLGRLLHERARRGEARRGEARRGEARRGEARRGEARHRRPARAPRPSEARRGEARRGEARRGEAR
jgi:hypothetical protein